MFNFNLQKITILAMTIPTSLVLIFPSSPVMFSNFSTAHAAGDILCDSSSNPCLGTGEDEFMVGGKGNNIMRGQGGDDNIRGGSLDDDIIGGDGNDVISGDSGHDEISGGPGDDEISGGSGSDILEGDEGADSFKCGSGTDSLDDFNLAEDDTKSSDCELF
jgi:Ca2+-binding RTX toxin-like protein